MCCEKCVVVLLGRMCRNEHLVSCVNVSCFVSPFTTHPTHFFLECGDNLKKYGEKLSVDDVRYGVVYRTLYTVPKTLRNLSVGTLNTDIGILKMTALRKVTVFSPFSAVYGAYRTNWVVFF